MKIKYNLPKGYLSYSAIMLWINHPDLYRDRYYRNIQPEGNVYMNFGKKIAKILESRDYKDYPELKKVPYFPISEQQLIVDVNGIKVMAYLDLFEPKTFSFGEVKTGSVSHVNGPPWDAVKTAKHKQLPFYSFLIKKTYGKVNPIVPLIWIETRFGKSIEKVGSRMLEGDSRELELTGRVEVFNRRIAEWERLRIKKLIIKSAKEISDDYSLFQKTL